MRILIVSESFFPVLSGVSIVTQRLAKQLVSRGHQVAVICASPTLQFYTEDQDGYSVYRMPSIPNPFRKGLRFAPATGQRVTDIIEEWRPDIVHIHDPGQVARSAVQEAGDRKIPVIATHHFMIEGLLPYLSWLKPLQQPLSLAGKKVITSMYSECTRVIVPTEMMREYLLDWDIEVPVSVVSNGVDLVRFHPQDQQKARAHFGIPVEGLVIGYTGRIDPEKNIDLLLRIIAHMQKILPCTVVMAGGGNKLEEYQGLAEELEIQSQVIWLPPIPHHSEALPSLYAALDLFCMPSKAETESIATMEAMATGLPILAANVGGLPELVDDTNGCLVTGEDINEWVLALSKLLNDREALKKMGEVSQYKIAGRALERSISRLEQIYQEVLLEN